MKPVYYSEYLQLHKVLEAQEEESKKNGVRADDEMLFIIIHQTYELWFKQLLHEVNIVREVFQKQEIEDNSADIENSVHRLKRCGTILKTLVQQIDIMETMTPLDFLDFRDFLRPASGFQSIQFKVLEAMLGLLYENRVGQDYYLSQLNEKDRSYVQHAEKEISLFVLLDAWLARMPFAKENNSIDGTSFITDYKVIYENSLLENEKSNLDLFNQLFIQKENTTGNRLSTEANKAALFIMLYRNYPLLHAPFQVIQAVLDIDDLLAQWRYRHVNMVMRMIGKRVGTGGSTGASYLKHAAQSHYIFKEFADLTSFLIQRSKLPKLSDTMKSKLCFSN